MLVRGVPPSSPLLLLGFTRRLLCQPELRQTRDDSRWAVPGHRFAGHAGACPCGRGASAGASDSVR